MVFSSEPPGSIGFFPMLGQSHKPVPILSESEVSDLDGYDQE